MKKKIEKKIEKKKEEVERKNQREAVDNFLHLRSEYLEIF